MKKIQFSALLMLVMALVFCLSFTGCSSDGGGDKKEEEVLDDLSLVGLIDGKLVQTIISKPSSSKAAITPADGYNYVIMYYATKVVISKGTIKYNPPTITFIPENAADEEFTGTYSDGKIQSVDVIIDGETYPMSLGDAELPTPLVDADPVVFNSASGAGLNPAGTVDGKFGTTKYSVGDAAAALTVVVSDNHNVTVGTVTRPFAGTISYQWYKAVDVGGTPGTPGAPGTPEPITGAKAASYTPSTSKAGITWYWVEVTNSMTGYTSVKKPSAAVPIEVAALKASEQPAFTTGGNLTTAEVEYVLGTAPGSVTALGVTLEALQSGVTTTLSYQWYSAASSTAAGTIIPAPDGTATTYKPVISATITGTTYYWVVITNQEQESGEDLVPKTLTSAKKPIKTILTRAPTPTITTHPQTAAYEVTDVVTALSVAVTAVPNVTFTYQWYKPATAAKTPATDEQVGNGTATLTLTTPATTAGVSYYYVVVTNPGETDVTSPSLGADSNIATITITKKTGSAINMGGGPIDIDGDGTTTLTLDGAPTLATATGQTIKYALSSATSPGTDDANIVVDWQIGYSFAKTATPVEGKTILGSTNYYILIKAEENATYAEGAVTATSAAQFS